MEHLPGWAKQFSERYYSGAYSTFVLHGNVHDLVTSAPARGKPTYLPLNQFLQTVLFEQRDIVLCYDRGGGISFATASMQADFRNAMEGYDSFHGTKYSQGGLPRNPDGVLTILDNYLRLRLQDKRKIALIVEYAETIVPAGGVGNMPADDRNALVIFQRWAHNPVFK